MESISIRSDYFKHCGEIAPQPPRNGAQMTEEHI